MTIHEKRREMVDRWIDELVPKLGVPKEVLQEKGLYIGYFRWKVQVLFEDGSSMNLNDAILVHRSPEYKNYSEVAIFTEHCGYYEYQVHKAEETYFYEVEKKFIKVHDYE